MGRIFGRDPGSNRTEVFLIDMDNLDIPLIISDFAWVEWIQGRDHYLMVSYPWD
jgi:hypothetical protein